MNPITALKDGITHDLKRVAAAFSRVIRTRGNNVATELDPSIDWWSVRRSLTGIRINEDTAITLTAVYRAVSIIASTIGALPLHVKRTNQFGEESIEESPQTAIIWHRPNPEMTRITFWETVVGHEVLNGNAYIFVVKNADGRALELWPLAPWRVTPGRTKSGMKVYDVDGEYSMKDFTAGGEIIHVMNMSRDGLVGLSPIRLAATSMELSLAAEQYGARFFGQDSTPSGLLSTDQVLTEEQATAISERWEAQHAGLGNRKIAVLGNGAKFDAISINPEDAQLLEERRFQVAEIARLFGVPPHLLADMERSTSWGSGLEEQGINFLRYTLLRHIEAFEQAIDDALLNRVETRRKAKFVTDGLLRASYQVRMQGHSTAHGRFMTANEIRKLEGLPPISGGDELLQMTNLVPAESLEEAVLGGDEPANPPPGGGIG